MSKPELAADHSEHLRKELEYHEALYSGFAQSHFARPAVRALRENIVARILRRTGAGPSSRVLSLGSGIGDTELLLACHVGRVDGVELSPAAVRQARADAERLAIQNVSFVQGAANDSDGIYDVVIAIFFLHHLPNSLLLEFPARIAPRLKPGGVFYSLDPSSRRLSGAVGRLFVPRLMKKYQSDGERELHPEDTTEPFRLDGFDAHSAIYDFGSTPIAGLFPGSRAGYRAARRLDNVLLRVPAVRRFGSNFEILARKL